MLWKTHAYRLAELYLICNKQNILAFQNKTVAQVEEIAED